MPEGREVPDQGANGETPSEGDNGDSAHVASPGGCLDGSDFDQLDFGDASSSEPDTPERGRKGDITLGFLPEDDTDLAEARAGKRKVSECSPIKILSSSANTRSHARKALAENAWLSGDDIATLQDLIFEFYQGYECHVEDFVRMHPFLSFPERMPLVPKRVMNKTGVLFTILFHDSSHWTIARMDMKARHILWYDPLGSTTKRLLDAKQLCTWIDNDSFTFEEAVSFPINVYSMLIVSIARSTAV